MSLSVHDGSFNKSNADFQAGGSTMKSKRHLETVVDSCGQLRTVEDSCGHLLHFGNSMKIFSEWKKQNSSNRALETKI